jgi:hypothetical protein
MFNKILLSDENNFVSTTFFWYLAKLQKKSKINFLSIYCTSVSIVTKKKYDYFKTLN